MMVAAGIDAAADLQLQLAQLLLPVGIGKALRDLLRDGNRARIGKAAIIQTGAGDDVADEIEIGGAEIGFLQRLPDGVEVRLLNMRQHDVLGVSHA